MYQLPKLNLNKTPMLKNSKEQPNSKSLEESRKKPTIPKHQATTTDELGIYKHIEHWKNLSADMLATLRSIRDKGDRYSKLEAGKAIRKFEENK